MVPLRQDFVVAGRVPYVLLMQPVHALCSCGLEQQNRCGRNAAMNDVSTVDSGVSKRNAQCVHKISKM